ncbi:DNA gyrase C-terminal beta-propeller domain-containing protein, partial [Chloroflexota bacterium]
LTSRKGKAVRFAVGSLRASGRLSGGVRGIRLAPGDQIADMDILSPNAYLVTISSNGFGKLSRLEEYPLHQRGGMGVRAHEVNERTGDVAGAKVVYPHQEVMLISADGVVIRTPVSGITIQSRSTQGVSLMKPRAGDQVVAIALLNGSKDTKS